MKNNDLIEALTALSGSQGKINNGTMIPNLNDTEETEVLKSYAKYPELVDKFINLFNKWEEEIKKTANDKNKLEELTEQKKKIIKLFVSKKLLQRFDMQEIVNVAIDYLNDNLTELEYIKVENIENLLNSKNKSVASLCAKALNKHNSNLATAIINFSNKFDLNQTKLEYISSLIEYDQEVAEEVLPQLDLKNLSIIGELLCEIKREEEFIEDSEIKELLSKEFKSFIRALKNNKNNCMSSKMVSTLKQLLNNMRIDMANNLDKINELHTIYQNIIELICNGTEGIVDSINNIFEIYKSIFNTAYTKREYLRILSSVPKENEYRNLTVTKLLEITVDCHIPKIRNFSRDSKEIIENYKEMLSCCDSENAIRTIEKLIKENYKEDGLKLNISQLNTIADKIRRAIKNRNLLNEETRKIIAKIIIEIFSTISEEDIQDGKLTTKEFDIIDDIITLAYKSGQDKKLSKLLEIIKNNSEMSLEDIGTVTNMLNNSPEKLEGSLEEYLNRIEAVANNYDKFQNGKFESALRLVCQDEEKLANYNELVELVIEPSTLRLCINDDANICKVAMGDISLDSLLTNYRWKEDVVPLLQTLDNETELSKTSIIRNVTFGLNKKNSNRRARETCQRRVRQQKTKP